MAHWDEELCGGRRVTKAKRLLIVMEQSGFPAHAAHWTMPIIYQQLDTIKV
jgi:hypothetical protein